MHWVRFQHLMHTVDALVSIVQNYIKTKTEIEKKEKDRDGLLASQIAANQKSLAAGKGKLYSVSEADEKRLAKRQEQSCLIQ